jgi:hypothetical protein
LSKCKLLNVKGIHLSCYLLPLLKWKFIFDNYIQNGFLSICYGFAWRMSISDPFSLQFSLDGECGWSKHAFLWLKASVVYFPWFYSLLFTLTHALESTAQSCLFSPLCAFMAVVNRTAFPLCPGIHQAPYFSVCPCENAFAMLQTQVATRDHPLA